MNIEEVRSYALSLPGVTEDQPFGEDNVTFRVEGKIFLCLWLGEKEASDGLVSMRKQGGGEQAQMPMEKFAQRVNDEVKEQLKALDE